MRLGLFGGTFDPIHLGHLILAEACREACALDRLWFIVTATPPHKPTDRTPVAHRLEMARIATAGHPAFEISEIEADAASGPHYSYRTLERIAGERPGDELYFLIGADSLADLPHWREPARVARLATIVVVNRPGIDRAVACTAPDLGPGVRPFRFVEIPPIGISSTELRARVAAGRSIRYQVPRGVEAYIAEHGLYRAGAGV
ncbi:MAG: putative nicotinate-nucleotide adenylyltransferase [Isosphaeraceae bacterium]|jgi:nicotinate-nucleotide adenylyltransferase|nr:MAG: putative nicotinate-nucleotide adenylyltransferase [Isosphaeraceae bacterium]